MPARQGGSTAVVCFVAGVAEVAGLPCVRVRAVAFTRQNRHILLTRFLGRHIMPSKPNYNFQRAERDRAKKALKDLKLQERKEQAARRKAGEGGEAEPSDGSAQGSGE
jgi:hypothetical protein